MKKDSLKKYFSLLLALTILLVNSIPCDAALSNSSIVAPCDAEEGPTAGGCAYAGNHGKHSASSMKGYVFTEIIPALQQTRIESYYACLYCNFYCCRQISYVNNISGVGDSVTDY